mmetsp:Transcript_43386/g.70701  ORF Transcript_43386/g.70701 Transcript_43386/m.70701 type:complete len:230 (+) Transcript_43386:2838-3527(+)
MLRLLQQRGVVHTPLLLYPQRLLALRQLPSQAGPLALQPIGLRFPLFQASLTLPQLPVLVFQGLGEGPNLVDQRVRFHVCTFSFSLGFGNRLLLLLQLTVSHVVRPQQLTVVGKLFFQITFASLQLLLKKLMLFLKCSVRMLRLIIFLSILFGDKLSVLRCLHSLHLELMFAFQLRKAGLFLSKLLMYLCVGGGQLGKAQALLHILFPQRGDLPLEHLRLGSPFCLLVA